MPPRRPARGPRPLSAARGAPSRCGCPGSVRERSAETSKQRESSRPRRRSRRPSSASRCTPCRRCRASTPPVGHRLVHDVVQVRRQRLRRTARPDGQESRPRRIRDRRVQRHRERIGGHAGDAGHGQLEHRARAQGVGRDRRRGIRHGRRQQSDASADHGRSTGTRTDRRLIVPLTERPSRRLPSRRGGKGTRVVGSRGAGCPAYRSIRRSPAGGGASSWAARSGRCTPLGSAGGSPGAPARLPRTARRGRPR